MGCLGLISVLLFFPIFIEYLIEEGFIFENVFKSLVVIFLMGALIALPSWFLYWGFTMRWEYKDRGKNAIADFWKSFWSGNVPRIVDIWVEQPTVNDYLKRLGKYPEEISDADIRLGEEFGDDEYVVFDFYRGIMHVDVYVYIPVKQMKKLQKVIDCKPYKIEKVDERYVLRYRDGEEVEITVEDVEVIKFLDALVNSQPENIEYIKRLKEQLLSGKLTPRDYILRMFDYKFFGKKKVSKLNQRKSL